MASKAKRAAKKVAATDARLIWSHFCPRTTDPAVVGVHPDVFATLDATTQRKVTAAEHEGKAALHKTLADANTNIANILKSGG